VHFAYVDESGDKGVAGSKSYTLGCLLVDAARWTEVFDQVLLYRRFLKKQFGIPVRSEIKANYLVTSLRIPCLRDPRIPSSCSSRT
jgi:hypothetical protein